MAPIKDLRNDRNRRRKSVQDYLVGRELFLLARLMTVCAHQNLPFDASLAADKTPPVICRICSPALVN